ncbi:exo-alpha-sialidase [Micromonospora lupini]|uniref:sialidase family protein n=1 Tax=Micromonospora lupini TaxID=285679 RepID=UPI00225393C5|nr:sialidase family protein [Micromonospora lupini]MCX5069031.1 exo-alpha-sialidase [Micromonospora lupini]
MARLAAGLTSVLVLGAGAGVAAPALGSVTLSTAAVGVQQVLFRSGTGGYGCYRIPAMVKSAAGSLLAFAEARKSPSCADRGDIDLVVRRSTNNGRTWGPIRVVLTGSDTDADAPFTRGNAAPVVDETTGQIFLISTSNPVTITGDRLPWLQESDDDGISWSAPRALGTTFSGSTDGWFATGPSHGIQLRNGAHAGRLVVGAHQVPDSTTVNAGVLYSDDHGTTWHAGPAANSYVPGVMNPGEVSVAELPGGSIYAEARNQIGGSGNHRARAVSTDAAMPAFTAVPSLVGPDVQGAVLTLRSVRQSQPGDTLIYSGPADPTDRKLLQIRYSTDQGVTWKTPSHGLITNDRSGYSDLAELSDGEIGVLYEGGANTDEFGNSGFSADEIRFTRLTPSQLGLPGTFTGLVSPQTSPAAAPTTPDATPEANDGYLSGNAALAAGRFGQGLSLDGTGDYLDVPFARTVDPGAGDFTYSTWFSYHAGSTSPDQVLFWGYGVGADKPQLWLRAQPSQDRLFAWVQGVSGRTTVAVTDAVGTGFGDGAWHHLSLVRSGGQVTLTVDGTRSGSATGVAGSVTGSPQDGVEGLRLGARPDATAADPFTGALDDFRFYRQALTGDQLDQLYAANTAVLDDDPEAAVNKALGLRLPFQVIDAATPPTRTRVAIEDDVSGHCASATLLGGAPSLAAGRIDSKALAVNSAHPGVQTPFRPTLDVGSGDFTFTTWFQYTASSASPNQVLVWAYGLGAEQRQVWLRAQPAQDRLYALVQTDAGQVGVGLKDGSSATAFGDQGWHLLALTRSGGQVQLSVDGGTPASAAGLTGSVTANAAAGIDGLRLGSRPDGADVLTGNLDEFRLYHRALSAAELRSMAAVRYPKDNPAVRWTFESAYTQAHNVVVPSPASGPATPDSSVHCGDAYLRAGATTTTGGKFGAALTVGGTGGTVQLPYVAATALGSGDFTVSTWLRYTPTSAKTDQVVLWAYGVGASRRQLWLRAQPAQDRLYVLLQTETATTTVSAPDTSSAAAFGDNRWHHVALRRSAGTLSLIIDGVTRGSSVVPVGSPTYGDAFAVDGFQLGGKPGGGEPLSGSLDEFRIFRRSLTDAELEGVRLTNADLGTMTALRLPFDATTGR